MESDHCMIFEKALWLTVKQGLDRLRGRVPIFLIGGVGKWAAAQDAYYMARYFPQESKFSFYRWPSEFPPPFCIGIVHFYSRYSLLTSRWPKPLRFYHAAVITWFHGDPGDKNSKFGILGEKLARYLPYLKYVVTSCTLTAEKLLRWGVPQSKLKVVPLGVDINLFRPPSLEEKTFARRKFGIPDEAICIASFQKDGVGWGEGLEPKLEKGPDVFLKVMRILSREYPLFVLLTGPARGYVKRGLEKLNVPYHHSFVKQHSELLSYYHAADIYLITSREEGGPLALLESLASGLPVVSTKVGMAPDVICHGENGFLANIEDAEALASLVAELAEHPELQEKFVQEGYKTAINYSWDKIVKRLINDVYSKCLT